MIRSVFTGSLLGLALLAQPAAAQARRVSYDKIPPGQRPPAGLCRVWYDGVAPGRQPRVTDCRTARYQAARTGGRVIYGDEYASNGKGNGKAKGKYKERHDDRYDRRDDRYDRRDRRDDRYGRRDNDGRWDGRRDSDRRDDDGRWDGRRDDDRRNGSSTCVDANRDGRCDVNQSGTTGTVWPRGSSSGTSARTSTGTTNDPHPILRDKYGVKVSKP